MGNRRRSSNATGARATFRPRIGVVRVGSAFSIPDTRARVIVRTDIGPPGWGAKYASAVLARFGQIERHPVSAADGHPGAGREKLARGLRDGTERLRCSSNPCELRTDQRKVTVDALATRAGPAPGSKASAASWRARSCSQRAQAVAQIPMTPAVSDLWNREWPHQKEADYDGAAQHSQLATRYRSADPHGRH